MQSTNDNDIKTYIQIFNNKQTFILILIISIIVILELLNNSKFFEIGQVQSTIDGNEYNVVEIYEDRLLASNTIAELNQFTEQLIGKLKEEFIDIDPEKIKKKSGEVVLNLPINYKYPTADLPYYTRGRLFTKRLMHRYVDENIYENDPQKNNDTSYTINKGDQLVLCLREKKSGKYKVHDIHILKFVLLHELTHIFSTSLHHNDYEFWPNFKFLLKFAKDKNIYISKNYKQNPVDYCGLNVKYNPLYDDKIKL